MCTSSIFGEMFLETDFQGIFVFWGTTKPYIKLYLYGHLLTKLKQD